MKLNINKELLLKHRFWVMLGTAFLVGCVPLVLLNTTVKGGINDKASKLDKADQKGKQEAAKPDVKTEVNIKFVNDTEKNLSGRKDNVHDAGYRSQKRMFESFLPADPREKILAFPEELENHFEFTYVPESKHSPLRGLFAEVIRINTDKTAPADNELEKNIVHGTIEDVKDTYLKVRDKNNKVWKFSESPTLTNKWVFQAGQSAKPLADFRKLEKNQSVSVFFQRGKYFGDPLTFSERKEFRRVYKELIHPILELVDPIDENGKGRVRLGNWNYAPDADPPDKAPFFDFVRGKTLEDNPWPQPNSDFSDDFWIFQENLWIYKELFTIIKEANDSVARFDRKLKYPKGKEPKAKDKIKPLPTSYVFANPYWEIELRVPAKIHVLNEKGEKVEKDNEGDTVQIVMSNLLSRGQKFDFDLRLKVSNAPGAEPLILSAPRDVTTFFNPKGFSKTKTKGDVEIEGEDVQTVELKAIAGDGKSSVDLRQTEILEMWQELTWETSPVRRIDGIYISDVTKDRISESHRSFSNKPLKPYVRPSDTPAGPGPAPAPGPGVKPGPGPGPGPGKPGPAPAPAVAGKDKGKDAGAKSVYGHTESPPTMLSQKRDRYCEISRQLRRLPVAVSLTVEQSQVDRVQAAFNNSSLRFLSEQVILTHSAGSVNPGPKTSREVGAAVDQPKVIPDFAKKGNVSPRQPASQGGSGDELEANVEIVLYGVITIYERYPPRLSPPADWGIGASPAPAAPPQPLPTPPKK